MMIDEALLEKLRHIKALADDGQCEHECQTALLMFQKLLKKHGLSERDVPIDDAAKEEIKKEQVYENASVPLWVRYLHNIVARHFRCMPVSDRYTRAGRTTRQVLTFIGHENDTRIAQAAFDAAYHAAQRMCAERQAIAQRARKLFGGATLAFNNTDYLIGFVNGIDEAYKNQEAESGTALIVTTPSDVLAAVEDLPTQRHRMRETRNLDSAQAGYIDGNNIGRGDALRST